MVSDRLKSRALKVHANPRNGGMYSINRYAYSIDPSLMVSNAELTITRLVTGVNAIIRYANSLNRIPCGQ